MLAGRQPRAAGDHNHSGSLPSQRSLLARPSPVDAAGSRRSCTSSVRTTPWSGGTPICCSTSRTGCRSPSTPAVNPAIRWVPIASLLQITVDIATSNRFDEGFGHRYGTLPMVAWDQMLQPHGWSTARVDQLCAELRTL